jgi:protein-tyrosine-phosphatase
MAEAILRHLGGGRVAAHSAGSEPGRVHPDAIRTLEELGISTAGLTSKHLRELAGQEFDYVVTVCDSAKESCPVFPGHPTQVHWSFPDPSAISDEAERLQRFQAIASELVDRCERLLAEIESGEAGPVS